MRIVIDGRWVRQTGIGRYVEETTREVLKLDQKSDYQFLIRPADTAYFKPKAKNIAFVTADFRQFTFGEQLGLLKIVNDLKPDLVHFPNFAFPILYRGNFVLTIHDLTLFHFKTINASRNPRPLYELKHLAMRLTFLIGVKRARYIIVPTEYVRREVIKKYRLRPSKVVVTYEAAELTRVEAKERPKKYHITKPFLLYVGNAYPHKNIERLIIATGKLVVDYGLDLQLVIVGKKDVFRNRLEREVQRANLENRVIFTGFVPDDELAGLYKRAEAFVFPSLSEGFGLPGLEAMLYELPLVSSNATCLPEVYGDAAEYFDPRNVDDMAAVIAKLLGDKKRQAELVRRGLKQVKKYSWREVAEKTLAVYQKALRRD